MIDVFLHALILSFILLGIHAYFGFEIVRRGIIFTDIAIAQFSAVGLAISLLLYDKSSYALALLFAIFSSLLVALSQRKKEYAEAFIGILYALGFSSVVLLLSKSPHGMEEFLNLTASDILFVQKREILKTALLYTLFGLLIYLRKRFLKGALKEFTFFVLFSLTVTSSVELVGVFIVFSMLVAPALTAKLLNRGLLFAWVYGSLVNTLGIVISFQLDLPTGFSLVFVHSLLTALVFLGRVFI
ncbi:MAG: metal ABC transporter permease [Acidobacteria bacterium]|nr:MAG: metal ABC transporter permease [Acidobacteriota bacterium]